MSKPMRLKNFLKPISTQNPSGEDVRYNALFIDLKTLRFPPQEEGKDKEINFKKVAEKCEHILKTTSKDLQIACWLAEAWIYMYNIQGLSAGLDLIYQMTVSFWESVYPYKKEDAEFRLSPFLWLNEKLSDALLYIQLTDPQVPGIESYNLHDVIDAQQFDVLLSQAGPKKQELMEHAKKQDRILSEHIQKSRRITPLAFYQDVKKQVENCTVIITKLESFLEEKYPQEGVAFRKVNIYLNEINKFVSRSIEALETAPPKEEASEEQGEELSNKMIDISNYSLEELYSLVHTISQEIAKKDPRSIAPIVLGKSIEWGKMSTTELLQHFAKENIDLSQLTKILGIT